MVVMVDKQHVNIEPNSTPRIGWVGVSLSNTNLSDLGNISMFYLGNTILSDLGNNNMSRLGNMSLSYLGIISISLSYLGNINFLDLVNIKLSYLVNTNLPVGQICNFRFRSCLCNKCIGNKYQIQVCHTPQSRVHSPQSTVHSWKSVKFPSSVPRLVDLH